MNSFFKCIFILFVILENSCASMHEKRNTTLSSQPSLAHDKKKKELNAPQYKTTYNAELNKKNSDKMKDLKLKKISFNDDLEMHHIKDTVLPDVQAAILSNVRDAVLSKVNFKELNQTVSQKTTNKKYKKHDIKSPKIETSGKHKQNRSDMLNFSERVAKKDKRAEFSHQKEKELIPEEGIMDESDVTRVINRHISLIKSCYERQVRFNSRLAGKIVINFTIDINGNISKADETSNELNVKTAKCIISMFKKLKFPKPKGGTVTLEYPFIFSPN